MLNNKFTYIYVLIDPRDLSIRYVGKANNPKQRLSTGHLSDKCNCPRVSWIKSLKKLGLKPVEEIVDEVSMDEWQFWEQHYISLYKSWGFNLVNWAEGGLGGSGMKGKTHSQKSKDQISKTRQGYEFPKEHRDNLRKAKMGNKNAAGPRDCIVGSKHHGFIDKPVEQRDRYTNEVIKVWPNAYEAAQFYKQKWSSEIHFCCRSGKVRLGYRWQYEV